MREWRADLYELIFRSGDHAKHSAQVHDIVQRLAPGAGSLLDVACGTGWHLEALRRWYDVEGVDLSEAMLEIARNRLPGAPLHVGDMRDCALRRRFDAVICLSSSIAHMTTVADLQKAVSNVASHLIPGGVLIVEPWDAPETSPHQDEPWVTTAEEPGRKVVMIETTNLVGELWVQESHYLVWTPGRIEHLRDTTELGAFTHRDNLAAFGAAGLTVQHDPVGLLGRGLYIGVSAATFGPQV